VFKLQSWSLKKKKKKKTYSKQVGTMGGDKINGEGEGGKI
jgi:hypothetical protein